ncbi:hypothetical protein M1L60_25795 [Actinoplanes sp. TRM 88003]|uniref:Uncharacterized protein n=1 Tax=Paractinoplanes aksuensis TaxID=2939490 RepID=A0ABT1DU04_9ACTN|nr:hypothetical protein [Actinoplanes aksuensis]MCO8274018.1 hypothetical protein [Actinoplanes aksuensis]
MRIAVAQTDVTTDPRVNGVAIRDAMRRAAGLGARLVHSSEGALSGHGSDPRSTDRTWL